MNTLLLIAGALSLIVSFVHALIGEFWILTRIEESSLPDSRIGDANVTKRMLRATWHFVSFDFLVSAIILILVATSDFNGTSEVAVRIISIHFFGYVIIGILVAFNRLSVLVRTPQLLVLLLIAILTWLGA